MGDIEDTFFLLLSTNILSMAVLELCATDYILLIMRLVVFFSFAFNGIICVYVSTN